ncbi:MAG: VOC family protein [Clostridiales bacterium]|nr:VOC family protein [Clostridiales bacterium]
MHWTLTTLEVSNLEESLRFYCGALGMPLLERFSNGHGAEIAMLGEQNAIHLELLCKGDTPAGAHGGFSIGFETENAADLAARLDQNFTGPMSPNPALKFYFIRDPDGYRVQLIERIK